MAAIAGAIGAAVIGGVFSAVGASKQNKAAKKAAQRQMDFQREMYGSRYQMTMRDMKLAGLNPILAYKTGVGSSPGGSTYSPTNVGAAGVQGAASGVSSAIAATRQKQELKNMREQQKLVKAQRDKVLQTIKIDKPSENLSREKDRLYHSAKGAAKDLKVTIDRYRPLKRARTFLDRVREEQMREKKYPTWSRRRSRKEQQLRQFRRQK